MPLWCSGIARLLDEGKCVTGCRQQALPKLFSLDTVGRLDPWTNYYCPLLSPTVRLIGHRVRLLGFRFETHPKFSSPFFHGQSCLRLSCLTSHF